MCAREKLAVADGARVERIKLHKVFLGLGLQASEQAGK